MSLTCMWCLGTTGEIVESGCMCLQDGKSVHLHPKCVAQYIKTMSTHYDFNFQKLDTCPTCNCSFSRKFQYEIGAQYQLMFKDDKFDDNNFLFQIMQGVHTCAFGNSKDGLKQMMQSLKLQHDKFSDDNFLIIFTKYQIAKEFLKQQEFAATTILTKNIYKVYTSKKTWYAHDDFFLIGSIVLWCIAEICQGKEKQMRKIMQKTLRQAKESNCFRQILKDIVELSICPRMEKARHIILEIVTNYDHETQQGWFKFCKGS